MGIGSARVRQFSCQFRFAVCGRASVPEPFDPHALTRRVRPTARKSSWALRLRGAGIEQVQLRPTRRKLRAPRSQRFIRSTRKGRAGIGRAILGLTSGKVLGADARRGHAGDLGPRDRALLARRGSGRRDRQRRCAQRDARRSRRIPLRSPSARPCAIPCALGAVSMPPWRANSSCSMRWCSVRTSAYPSPSSCRSRVEPSMSVNRNVTVPTGSDTSGRTRSTIAGDSSARPPGLPAVGGGSEGVTEGVSHSSRALHVGADFEDRSRHRSTSRGWPSFRPRPFSPGSSR